MSAERHPALAGARVIFFSIIANSLLGFVKLIAGYAGSSNALIADAVESFSDVVSSLVLAGGLVIASRPPDRNHPYGHGKAEPLATAVVGMSLGLAAFWVIWQSAGDALHHPEVPRPFTIGVLLVVIVVKELLFRFVSRAEGGIESTALKLEALHHRSDAITSLCALVGISLAVALGPDWAIADDVAAIFAALVILANAYRISRAAVSELSDESRWDDVEADVRSAAVEQPGVIEVEKCFIRKMGFDYYVDLHVVVDGDISVRAGHEIAHRVKDRIRTKYTRIAEVLVHVEPYN